MPPPRRTGARCISQFAFGDLLLPTAAKVVAAAFGVRWLLAGSYGGIAAEIAVKNMPPACFLYAATLFGFSPHGVFSGGFQRGPQPPLVVRRGGRGEREYEIPLPQRRFCLLLPPQAKVSRARRRETPLDIFPNSAIIKARVLPRSGLARQVNDFIGIIPRKPSLCRVAVFPFNPNAEHKSKQMECNGNRHLITSLRRDQAKPPRFLCNTLGREPLRNNCIRCAKICQC